MSGVLDLSKSHPEIEAWNRLKQLGNASITDLNLNFSDLRSVPEGVFDNLPKLLKLKLDNNLISDLYPGSFRNLHELIELQIYQNSLYTLPANVFHGLHSLQILNLGYSISCTLLPPKIFTGLSNLQNLNLTGGNLKELPPDIFSGLNKLLILNLDYNDLTSLPPGVFSDLSELQKLDINWNELTELPEGVFSDLTNLEELSFHNNKLTKLPNNVFLHQTKLQWLDFSGNELEELSHDIFKTLRHLRHLYITDNNIRDFSLETLTYLSSLEFLCISSMGLTHCDNLPPFNNLKYLNVSNNGIKTFPDHILLQMPRLEVICFVNNQLHQLPLSLMQLRNLSEVRYRNNPIEYIPLQLQRFLEILDRRNLQGQDVYNDPQNIHNSVVQKSFVDSVNRLTALEPKISLDIVTREIISNTTLTQIVKETLIDYAESKDIHSNIGLTFGEVLVAVWERIRRSDFASEILKVLNREMLDAECKCFTGRITRLVNCLNGFDADVVINISETEQLSNIASVCRNKFPEREAQIAHFLNEVRERGFEEATIDEWVAYF